MGGLEWSPERRSESADGSAPAVGQRLRRLLADLPTPFPCGYACFIHARRRQGEHGFGVITLSGESLPLTVAMLQSLRRVPTLFEGRTRVVIGPGDQEESLIPAAHGASWAVPLPVARLSMRMGIDDAPGWGPEEVLTPTADGPQLTLLCAGRPAGWPG
jgi:hypothetical protein